MRALEVFTPCITVIALAYALKGLTEATDSNPSMLIALAALPMLSAPTFHFAPGVGLAAGRMGDPQLYWDAPSQTYHIQPQYWPATAPPYHSNCDVHLPAGWGHATSTDLVGNFVELPITFGPCSISTLDEYTAAGTGCTLRLNSTHVGSLVNGDSTVGWETTNNYAAVIDSTQDALLVSWTQVSHGIEGNHSAGETGWLGTPGNHIPPPYGLIGNVVAYHNTSAGESVVMAVVSSSVGDPRDDSARPAFLLYRSYDFASWQYMHPLYTHPTAMSRAECGDFFPIGLGAHGVTAANVDFGKAAADAHWVLMWSRPARNGGGQSRSAGVVYFVGRLRPDGSFEPLTPLQAADYGASFYASQSVLGSNDIRLLMARVEGAQSLPRAVTLNEDLSLNFQPSVALAKHRTGTPLLLTNQSVSSSVPLPLPPLSQMLDALDLTIKVRGEEASSGQPAFVLREAARAVPALSLSIDFNSTTPTGTGQMRVLNIVAGGFNDSIPIAGSLVGSATFRVVVDGHIVEIFAGATPLTLILTLIYEPRGNLQATVEVVGGGAGPFWFDVEAHRVAPATITSTSTSRWKEGVDV